MHKESKLDLTGVELGERRPELDKPETLEAFWRSLEEAERADFERYDEYQAKIWEDLYNMGFFRKIAS